MTFTKQTKFRRNSDRPTSTLPLQVYLQFIPTTIAADPATSSVIEVADEDLEVNSMSGSMLCPGNSSPVLTALTRCRELN